MSTPITPCLWFDGDLEDAVRFWTGLFPHSKIGTIHRATPGGALPEGTVMAADWVMNGLACRGINGGPEHAGFTESLSFAVDCEDQDEVDRYWEALTADGGEGSVCGWLRDRFGLSWQIVPKRLYELMQDPHPARSAAATMAMLEMEKIVVADLERAADAAAPAGA